MNCKESLCESCFENIDNNVDGRCMPECNEANEYIVSDSCPYGWYHEEDYSVTQIEELFF